MHMKKLQRISLVFLLLPFLFSGAAGPRLRRRPSLPHTVTKIQVVCYRGGERLTRHYTQPNKIQPVLHYMRLLKREGAADTDPEQLIGDRFDITLYYSDGQNRIYRQRSNRYLSKNSQPWEKINTKQAQFLYPILQAMPSDL